jgi:5-methylthioribose kinase
VLKQSRPQLRTAEPWFCSPERIWCETATLQACSELLARRRQQDASANGIMVPDLLMEDRGNFAFAMSAVAEPHATWKSQLLAGEVCEETAEACGRLLGILHADTWHSVTVAASFENRAFFDALRLDPYYRFSAGQEPRLRDWLVELIQSVWSHRHCLVHGDFSPKNLLVNAAGVTLIDFEVGHYGDPAFDLGFFLTHLVLKAVRAPRDQPRILRLIDRFSDAYRTLLGSACSADEVDAVVERGHRNLAGCLIARVIGKSRIDYDVDVRRVLEIAEAVFRLQFAHWPKVRETIENST